jgi:hypothetical protein
MSVAPSEVRLETRIAPPVAKSRPLPAAAMAYLVAVAVAATAFAVPFLLRLDTDHHEWPTFAVLSVGAAITQLFKVRGVRNLNHHITPVFLVPAALLLPPQYVALVAIIQHVPEWLKVRYPWYIGGFNLCNFTLTNMCMWAAADGIMSLHRLLPSSELRLAAASSTTACSRRCCGSRAAIASRTPASSPTRASRRSSCWRRSASPSRRSGASTRGCCRSQARRS